MFVYLIFVYINIAMATFVCIYNGPGAADVDDYEEAYSQILSDEYTFRYVNSTDIIKQEVNIDFCTCNIQTILFSYKRETRPKFQQKVCYTFN